MDKQEYKILSEEIMTLVANEQFPEAAEIADRIDWRKVRSFTMLQRISDLYKINRRFEEALDIILMAYEKNPNSKTIVYSICELYLEMGDLITALQYMGVYNKMAPKDVGGAILKYKVLELEEAPYEDRIDQLEKIVSMSYQEEWAYQLAYMYHRMGLATKCVEVCNQLISWFGQGPFVIKAMELKMLHEKLSASQQEIYDHRNDLEEEIQAYEGEEDIPGSSEEEDFHVKTIDMSKFNTVNLQKALAESMRELMGEEGESMTDTGSIFATGSTDNMSDLRKTNRFDAALERGDTQDLGKENITRRIMAPMMDTNKVEDLSEETYESYPSDEGYANDSYPSESYPDDEYAAQEQYDDMPADDSQEAYETNDGYEGYEEVSDETAYVSLEEAMASSVNKKGNVNTDGRNSQETFFEDKTGDIVVDDMPLGILNELIPGVEFVPAKSAPVGRDTHERAEEVSEKPKNTVPQAPENHTFDDVLSFNSDGQIAMVVPEKSTMEKQITGQMNLQDVLSEWEKIKKKKEAQQNDEVRKNILERTGKIFEDYDESRKNGILAQIDEEQKKNNKVLQNNVKLRSVDEIAEETGPIELGSSRFSATAALNKTYGPNIWDEVEKSIAEDALAAAGTGAAVVAGAGAGAAVAAGVAAKALPVEDLAATASVGKGLFTSLEKAVDGEYLEDNYEDIPEYSEDGYYEDENDEYYEENSDNNTELNPEDYPDEYNEDNYEDNTEDYADENAEDSNDVQVNEGEDNSADSDEEGSDVADADKSEADAMEDTASDENIEESTEESSEENAEENNSEAVTENTSAAESESTEQAEEVNEESTTEEAKESDAEEAVQVAQEVIDTAQISGIGEALEEAAYETEAEVREEYDDNYAAAVPEERDFSAEEKEIFADYIYSKKMRNQILNAVDVISMASYVGNVLISGDSGSGTISLAKAMIKEIQLVDSNFVSSKVAKISGLKMNQKDIPGMFMQLANGALIVEKAGKLTKETLENITRSLENTPDGIIVILTDTKKEIEKLCKNYNVLTGYFNVRIDITPMSNNALVDYAKKYAYSKEYKIDEERAVLALHERISELQIGEHHVTPKEVERIVDNAIARSKRPHISAFVDILVAKRYDYEDMIILKEKDFES